MRSEDLPQIVIPLLLMAASVVAGVLVLFPPFERFCSRALGSPLLVKRVPARVLFFLAAFLAPFCCVAFAFVSLLRIPAVSSLFASAPWQVRLVCFLVVLLPAWFFTFWVLLHRARVSDSHRSAT
jgi:hypothetical protein